MCCQFPSITRGIYSGGCLRYKGTKYLLPISLFFCCFFFFFFKLIPGSVTDLLIGTNLESFWHRWTQNALKSPRCKKKKNQATKQKTNKKNRCFTLCLKRYDFLTFEGKEERAPNISIHHALTPPRTAITHRSHTVSISVCITSFPHHLIGFLLTLLCKIV